MPLKVIIAGAGIGGLCCAVALRQAGHEVEIFEKSAFASEVGAALALSPNGVRVLRHLGFSLERAQACPLRAWDVLRGTDLSRINILDLAQAEQKFGAGVWSVHRVDLHQELLRLATEDSGATRPAHLRLSSAVVAASPDGTVTLADGTTYSADVVIGADGVRSAVRDSILGNEPASKPVHSGLCAFRFLVPTEALHKDPTLTSLLDSHAGVANMLADNTQTEKERHMMWYGCHGGGIQNFVGIHPSDSQVVEDGEELKEAFKKEFAHFDPVIQRFIGLSDHIKRWPLYVHSPYPSWVKGRVALIGDAAHPMLPFGGQGSNVAIEDGAALGILLKQAQTGLEIEARLAQFEKLRKNRASRIQILSSVRAGREKEVEEEVRKYADSADFKIPTSHQERSIHDYSYDVFAACSKLIATPV